jgi:hypothetical protein
LGTLQDAHKIVKKAADEVRSLIQECLAEGRYSDVSAAAGVADALMRIIPHGEERPVLGPPPKSNGAHRRSHSRTPSQPTYPQFLRDRDKLVKIGWSKKAKAEYEHKAPRNVVNALVTAVRAKVGDGELFAASDVIPLPATGDDSIPDYQAYVVLKWLHAEGIITKHGRDRYAIERGKLLPNTLDEVWERLPALHNGEKR